MPTPNLSKVGGLEQTELDDLRSLAKDAVASLRNDLTSPDEKLRAAARKQLFDLGVFTVPENNKGVVAFLLERAKRGDFGKKAAIYAKESSADETHVDFIPGSAVEDDDPDTVRVADMAPPVEPPKTTIDEKRPITMDVKAPVVDDEAVQEDIREELRKKLLKRHNG